MEFVEAVLSGLRNYFNFRGRASRSEYWYFYLFIFLSFAIIGGGLIGLSAKHVIAVPDRTINLVTTAIQVFFFFPFFSLGVRRLHDINKTGWWLLIQIIPLIGSIIILIWACTKGDRGNNDYGFDPLEMDRIDRIIQKSSRRN